MNWAKTVKRHYDANRYSKDDVAVFVVANMITLQDYKDITGDDYPEAP